LKLFLIRHGQTTANLAKIYSGHQDVKLTDKGRSEAEGIRPILSNFKFDKVYSSDLCRAVETQKLALPGYEAIQTPLLREYDMGSLVGLGFQAAIEKYGKEFTLTRDYTPFGGENSKMVCERLRKFTDMLEAGPCDHVAAVAHNGIMSCMLENVIGAEYDRTAVKSYNCAIHVYEHDGIKWRLLAWNYMGRL